MKIRNYLDFLDAKKMAILRLFVHNPRTYTGRHVSYLTGISQRTCNRYLIELSEFSLLDKEFVGKSCVYELSNNYFATEVIKPMIEKEKKLYKGILEEIKLNLKSYVDAIIIYGSYARQSEVFESDLDICVITTKITEALEKSVEELVWKFKEKYRLTLSPHMLTKNEIKAKKQLQVIQDIKEDGVWILGDKAKMEQILW